MAFKSMTTFCTTLYNALELFLLRLSSLQKLHNTYVYGTVVNIQMETNPFK